MNTEKWSHILRVKGQGGLRSLSPWAAEHILDCLSLSSLLYGEKRRRRRRKQGMVGWRKRREERKGRREKRRKLPFIRSSHMQPDTTLTEILSIRFGVKIVSDVPSTEPGAKTLGTVTYTELLTGMSEGPNLSQRGIIPCWSGCLHPPGPGDLAFQQHRSIHGFREACSVPLLSSCRAYAIYLAP